MTNQRPKPVMVGGFTLILTAFLLLSLLSLPTLAQDPQKPTPEVQQLKDRLQQLEQTVEQLKAQIHSIDEAKKSGVAAGEQISAPAASASMTSAPMGAAPTAAPRSPDTPAGESSFTIYGFAMLDAGY